MQPWHQISTTAAIAHPFLIQHIHSNDIYLLDSTTNGIITISTEMPPLLT